MTTARWPSTLYFRKRLTSEILGEINEMILTSVNKEELLASKNDSDDDDAPENSGTMIVDATCAPSNIKYPQDTALLNEARENTEAMIDAMHTKGGSKPRTYRKRAHRDYLKLVRNRKPGAKKIRKALAKQLGYLTRNLGHIDTMLSNGKTLKPRQLERLETIRKLSSSKHTWSKITLTRFPIALSA